MINIEELREKQENFEGSRQELKKSIVKLEKERKMFLNLFPKNKFDDLLIEEYSLGGKKSENSFCYWIENKLQGLGNIHGATAFKFGIYFGKTKSDPELKYRYASKFGTSETEVFKNVKSEIISLLNSAKENKLDEIRENILSPMFKGKILSTYYPENYLNIFANEHLEYFLDKLEIVYSDLDDEIEKRQVLIDFKNKDLIMVKWSIYEFSNFLYSSFGRPFRQEDASVELKKYSESKNDYPKIKQVKANFIDLKINSEHIDFEKKILNPIGKMIDFEKRNKINKILGNRGEEIVFNLEKVYLKNLEKKELSEKIEWVSKLDDSLGYDILSYEEDGKKKYIEVKSTNQSPVSNANFLISSNQYQKAKELENYYFYIVFNAKTKNPKVWKIKNPLNYENKGLTLIPINFRVIINTKI